MTQVRAYLFSMLELQRGALEDAFLTKFPNDWVVWEPVVWKPSSLNPFTGQTLPAAFSTRPQERPDGDALCFELLTRTPVKLGRGADCDIRINEASVSREHLWLEPVASGWRLVPAAPRATTLLNGEPLTVEGADLRSGDELRLGALILRFHDSKGMAQRLDAHGDRVR